MAQQPFRSRFVWHELMTTDTKSAAAFFTKIVGWKTEPAPQNPGYTLFTLHGRPVAGLMAQPEDAKAMGAPPSWVSYVGTPDVAATARQAESLGGRILRSPMEAKGWGRFAILQDPQGAVFAAYTADSPSDEAGSGGVGEYTWHELITSDFAAAFTFYQRLFGWEDAGSMEMGPQGKYQMFGFGKQAFGGMFTPSHAMPPMWLPYVRVPDVTKSAPAIAKLGAKVINGPMAVPDGDKIVQGLDQQGAMFALHSKPAPTAQAAAPGRSAAARPQVKKRTAKARPAKRKAKAAKAKKARPQRKAARRGRAVRRAAPRRAGRRRR